MMGHSTSTALTVFSALTSTGATTGVTTQTPDQKAPTEKNLSKKIKQQLLEITGISDWKYSNTNNLAYLRTNKFNAQAAFNNMCIATTEEKTLAVAKINENFEITSEDLTRRTGLRCKRGRVVKNNDPESNMGVTVTSAGNAERLSAILEEAIKYNLLRGYSPCLPGNKNSIILRFLGKLPNDERIYTIDSLQSEESLANNLEDRSKMWVESGASNKARWFMIPIELIKEALRAPVTYRKGLRRATTIKHVFPIYSSAAEYELAIDARLSELSKSARIMHHWLLRIKEGEPEVYQKMSPDDFAKFEEVCKDKKIPLTAKRGEKIEVTLSLCTLYQRLVLGLDITPNESNQNSNEGKSQTAGGNHTTSTNDNHNSASTTLTTTSSFRSGKK